MQSILSAWWPLLSSRFAVMGTGLTTTYSRGAPPSSRARRGSTEGLFASRPCVLAPNSSNWKRPGGLCPGQALAVVGRPYHSAGMLVKGGMFTSTYKETMCRSGTCLLLQCQCQSLPGNPCSRDRSHRVSLCYRSSCGLLLPFLVLQNPLLQGSVQIETSP